MEPSHVAPYTKPAIERLASETLQKTFPQGIELPIDIDLVAEKQPLMDGFIFLPDIQLKFDTIAVLRNKSNGNFEIVVDYSICWARASFSIAHEIGHVVLHPELYAGCFTEEDSIALSKRIKRIYKRIEREANHFAGAILIPHKTIFNDVQSVYTGILQGYAGNIKWEEVIPTLHTALAKRYRVSVQTMKIRLEQLKIDWKLSDTVENQLDFISWF
jgi:hypothetical protein